MIADASPPEPPAPEEAVDIPALARALAGYLREIDDAYRTCLRHETTAAVYSRGRDGRLVQVFPASEAATATVLERANCLPGWRQSPFWRYCAHRWRALESSGRPDTPGFQTRFLRRGLSWHGQPILASAECSADGKRIALDLLLPEVYREPPELSIRIVARGLLCHGYLLPDRAAAPLPLAAWAPRGTVTVIGYLKRTMPENLYASHCIFGTALEQ